MASESNLFGEKLNELVYGQEAYLWLIWFDELNPAERSLVAIWELKQEIYNGGFPQYFMKGSGARVSYICDILRNIGAAPTASLLESAISLVGPSIHWDDDVERFRDIEALPEGTKDKLFELDSRFDEQVVDLDRLLSQYLSKHQDQIDAPEEFWKEATNQ
jgi:hypothetical protein